MTSKVNKLFLIVILAAIPVLIMAASISAQPQGQVQIFTPTPGPDGRIIYIVKPNDTLLGIELITGVSVEELKAINNLAEDTIFPGQRLLIGYAGPAEITNTPGPSPTPTEFIPTQTPLPGFGTICVLIFNDKDGDSIRTEFEDVIPDGAIDVTSSDGTSTLNAVTASGSDPHCFENVPEGVYNVTVAIPEGYNTTTMSSYALKLKAGDVTYLNFGAQPNSETITVINRATESNRSPLLGILGGVFILIGILSAIFYRRIARITRR